MKRTVTAAAAVLILAATGCIRQMTGIAPCTTPVTARDSYTVLGDAHGESFGIVINAGMIGIPVVIPIFEDDMSRSAVERAIRAGGGNALVEVCEQATVVELLLVQLHWTTVRGRGAQVIRGGARTRVGVQHRETVNTSMLAGSGAVANADPRVRATRLTGFNTRVPTAEGGER